MKNVYFVLLLFFCVNVLYGQRAKKPKINYFMNVDVGFIFEKYDGFDDRIYERISSQRILKKGNNYLGFGPISFGFSKIKNKKLSELQLEWIDLKSNTILHYSNTNNFLFTDSKPQTSRSLSIHYFYSLYQIGEKNIFDIGPSLGAGYIRHRLGDEYYSFANYTPLSTSCVCLHLGIRMNYQIVLSKFWRLNIASRLVLLDAGFYRDRRLDPSLPPRAQISSEGIRAEFWREQYPLTVGLSYRIK